MIRYWTWYPFQSLFCWNVLLNVEEEIVGREVFKRVSILVLLECPAEFFAPVPCGFTPFVSILVLLECPAESHFMYIV